MSRQFRAYLLSSPGIFAAVALAGCGNSEPTRLPVKGAITVDGAPLDSGSITFAPLEGSTSGTVEVIDGQFRASGSSGVAPGKYQVEIVSIKPTGKQIPNPDLPSQSTPEVRNVIPTRYNVDTTLLADVKADGDNSFSFNLTTKSPARNVRRR